MKIIFAQGNPDAQYMGTRHNVGFKVVDTLAAAHNVTFTKKPKFHADVAETSLAGEKVLLVKPTTFYNETGHAARLIVDFYKLDPDIDLLVIHDDLALPFGTLRIRTRGSDAGNNGIKSLNSHIGESYTRIRVGIYNDLRERVNDVNFVLGMFTKDESEALNATIIPKVIELVEHFCAEQLETTSHSVIDA
jgi:PTH1 family peptidyl-tRNA hydrolase